MLIVASCKSTKFVPKDRYLLKKNKIEIIGASLDQEELKSIIRQQPNDKTIGLKWDLFLFNRIDSSRVLDKRRKINTENHFINERRKSRQNTINIRRIEKARIKNKDYYNVKTIDLKDTLEPNLFLREWLKYKIGEKPVIFDSTLFYKSVDQLGAYLKKKGFYYGEIKSEIIFKKKKKAIVNYKIETGERYLIDSVYIESTNSLVTYNYDKFIKNPDNSLINQPFDSDFLDNYRTTLARFMKDQAIYGYSPNSIKYSVDTNKTNMKVILGLKFLERMTFSKSNNDSLVEKKYIEKYISDVYFHIIDTNSFNGNFKEKTNQLGISLLGKYLPTIDTLNYCQIKKRNSNEIDSSRIAYFLYNGDLFLKPEIMEIQSLLERGDKITETNIENTYSRFQQSDYFQTIKTEITELIEPDKVQIDYYLIPSKKQSFGAQTRITNTNGYFGLSSGLSYTNKNLFKGGKKLTLSINGSIQAQPPIIDEKIDNKDLKALTTKFYQFEIGPSLKFELPGLLFLKKTKFNKSRLARTIINTAYSFQKRDLYTKEYFQMNYSWKYEIRNTQTIQMGFPGISGVKFVNIIKSDAFETYLKQKNNPFLSNTFSSQFVWQDWRISFEYRDKNKVSKKHLSSFYYLGTFDLAGNLLSAFKMYQAKDTIGPFKDQHRVNGLVYSQFSRLDNTIIYAYPFSKTQSINMRALVGLGLTYGNSKTSMPYDYSFYAGGANDVRGWRASTLGPGAYKYYIDTNGTNIQVGDIRIAGSAEYRFQFNKQLKGAFFIDAGNIWTIRTDNNRIGSEFSGNWFKEIALAPGIGIRRDFDFFIVRVDFGFPIHNPALPIGERWIFQKHNLYNDEVTNFITKNPNMTLDAFKKIDSKPFTLNISFGIGYPF